MHHTTINLQIRWETLFILNDFGTLNENVPFLNQKAARCFLSGLSFTFNIFVQKKTSLVSNTNPDQPLSPGYKYPLIPERKYTPILPSHHPQD